MDELVRQIRTASDAGLYYLALIGALVLPDICGALASENGRSSGSKFKAWLREFVPDEANDADLIWGLRCSLVHQGQAFPQGGHFPIAFMYPRRGGPELHNFAMQHGDDVVGWLSIPIFVEEVTRGVEQWLEQFGNTATVVRNLDKFVRLRPEGLPPFVVGGPVIA